MRLLTKTLFILGIPWAFFACAFVLMAIGIFLPEYNYQAHDIAISLLLASWSVMGIFIWYGFRWRWALDRFPFLSRRRFWALSLLHHVGWLLIAPLTAASIFGGFGSFPGNFLEFWILSGTPLLLLLLFWLLANIVTAVLLFFRDQDRHPAIPEDPQSA